MEQRKPVFGLWLELPGTLSPSELPLISCVLFSLVFLSLSFSFLLLLSFPRFFHRYVSHSIFSHGSSSSLYLSRYPPLLRSLILDVVQVASKRTTGSSRRGSFLSLRLFAHLFLSTLSRLFPCIVLSLLPPSLPLSSPLVQRRT